MPALAIPRRHADPSAVLARLRALDAAVDAGGRARFAVWRPRITRRAFVPAAWNFAAYLALRSSDMRPLQTELMPLGLSSLGRCEGRVRPNVTAAIDALAARCGEPPAPPIREWTFFRGERLLRAETERVFGPPPATRNVRIMVTLPSEAANDAGLVADLVRAGMDAARINCAHDDAAAWHNMVANVRAAERDTGRRCRVYADLAGPKVRTQSVRVPHDARVRIGDALVLVRHLADAGHRTAALTCSVPEVIDRLRRGDSVWIDDGKIGCAVESVESGRAALRVTEAPARGARLRPAKGLNFPRTDIPAPALGADDRAALAALIGDVDTIGFSFVRRPSDIAELQAELTMLGRPQLPLALKIETLDGVANLPELIVQAAGRQPCAVMIARGDLAVEIGYRRLAEVQEEMLWLCEAAHVPVVWATQVLDSLVRDGISTRAEFTDAAMAERADCVMLNKGPYVVDGVEALVDILGRMRGHQTKKTSRLRALHAW